jgi:hypothetical protein
MNNSDERILESKLKGRWYLDFFSTLEDLVYSI